MLGAVHSSSISIAPTSNEKENTSFSRPQRFDLERGLHSLRKTDVSPRSLVFEVHPSAVSQTQAWQITNTGAPPAVIGGRAQRQVAACCTLM